MRTWLLACAAVFAVACSNTDTGPTPGDTPPGAACTLPAECGCWECTCVGVGGDPGAAQLCKPDGHCPSGMEACATSCDLAGAAVAQATPVESCPGRL